MKLSHKITIVFRKFKNLKNLKVLYSDFWNSTFGIKLIILLCKIAHWKEVIRVKQKVKRGEKVKVAFLIMDCAIWKVDPVFNKLIEHELFEPLIVVIPRLNAINEKKHLAQTYRHFKLLGYPVMSSFNQSEKSWIEIKNHINPDIIFFSNPHKITYERYCIRNFLSKLTCYVPYFEQICKDFESHLNNDTLNFCWKVFQINEFHKQYSESHTIRAGGNVLVSGYPAVEPLYDPNYVPKKVWRDNTKLKVIIAPHHDFSKDVDNKQGSLFIDNADWFIKLVKEFVHEIDFAFKPHPLLKAKLYKRDGWGKQRTDSYWEFWNSEENTQLEEGPYIDLFLGSDALIHDCSSFIIEYQYLNKPVIYLNPSIKDRLNDYGKLGLSGVELAYDTFDIEEFLSDIARGNLENKRNILRTLIPHKRPSTTIVEYLDRAFDVNRNNE